MRLIALTILFSLLATFTRAQQFSGYWQGKIADGSKDSLLIAFEISGNTPTYNCSIMVPAQGIYGLPGKITVNGDSLHIDIKIFNASFKGKLNNNQITGVYKQGWGFASVTLKRAGRPQTPKPPYPYYTEDVAFDNADKSVHFGATLSRPKGKAKYPAVIIITGSGPQDRDGTMFGHKPYAVLADYLTRQGIAVLRVDDRGTGTSTLGSNPGSVTTATLSYDAEAALNYLEARPDIDKKHLGLIGHSEGGIIAPMIAARRKDVSFIVMWAGPAVGGAVVNTEQNAFALKKMAINTDAVNAFKELHLRVLALFGAARDEQDLDAKALMTFNEWKATQSPVILSALMVNGDHILGKTIAGTYNGLYDLPWMRYFITYHPTTDLVKVKCPVLAIDGSKDTQVEAKANLPLINQTLAKAGNKDFKTVELPGLNHLLQTANTGDDAEYGVLEETISPMALKTIGDWVKLHVK